MLEEVVVGTLKDDVFDTLLSCETDWYGLPRVEEPQRLSCLARTFDVPQALQHVSYRLPLRVVPSATGHPHLFLHRVGPVPKCCDLLAVDSRVVEDNAASHVLWH